MSFRVAEFHQEMNKNMRGENTKKTHDIIIARFKKYMFFKRPSLHLYL